MKSIITYISVPERTKEIGILRSIGASKRDIARVFNAGTAIAGFSEGCIGILLISGARLSDEPYHRQPFGRAEYSVAAARAVSVPLTVTAGLIPAFAASAKDPAAALRPE